MKANEPWTTNEKWTAIVTALKAASDAGTWAFWRERFNTNHPEHIRNEEIENPTQFAYANWVAAKHVYCTDKDEIDAYCKYLMNSEPFPGITQQVEFFMAMKSVVDKEMEAEMEKVLIDDVEELEQEPVEELDEDEQYVRETEGKWEGDEYVSVDGDDEELEDFELMDEE